MNKRARKHLEMALGGNMNIATLKPLALIEIMTDFAKKEVEAINYTRCCETLKDKKAMTFDEYKWKFFDRISDYKWSRKTDGYVYSKEDVYLEWRD